MKKIIKKFIEKFKKKGFTLVELLAVIAILAILIIIALPNIMNLFMNAKENSFTNELKEIYKTAQSQWMNDSMFETGDKTYSRCSDSSCTTPLKMSGRDEIEYVIKLDKNGKVIKFQASDGTYQYSYSGNGLNIEDIGNVQKISNLSEDDILTIKGAVKIATFVTRQVANQVTMGDEVTIAGENFYVVSSDSSETVLLSKYDINTTSNTQVTSGHTTMKFSNIGYWDGCKFSTSTFACTSSPEGLISPYNNGGKAYCTTSSGTNCTDVFDQNSNLYNSVTAYAGKIATATGESVEGRLLRVEEAYAMKNSTSTYAQNAMKDQNSSYYLLGSALSNRNVFRVNSSGDINSYYFYNAHGVRPVIVVSTSAL